MQRAIGIVRVSQVRGRNGEDFASPEDQRDRIAAECKRRKLRLTDVVEELDVPGATPLERRHGLRSAIESVEAGTAHAIVVAYFDRLVRSLRIQEEILERVEAAGGRVLAVDFGEVSGKTSAQWLSTTLLGAVNQYHGKVLAERVRGAQKRATARGVASWSPVIPGYSRNSDGVYEPNDQAPVVRQAFRMRAGGKSIRECRDHLAQHGIKRTLASVGRLFQNRAVLGEIRFGGFINPNAHEPIIDLELFKAAQRAQAPRGRQTKSEMLLARLGVVRCGTCGSRLVAGSSNNGTTPLYRCRNPDCTRKVTISAKVVEPIISQAVQEALRERDVEGRASAEAGVRDAERKLEQAQTALDKAIQTLEDFMDEPMAVNKIRKLREEREAARERVDQLGGSQAAVVLRADRDWDRLSLDGRRDLIRAVIERATVAPGRGDDRVTVELVGQ
jgi:site-specific DNA recombinase